MPHLGLVQGLIHDFAGSFPKTLFKNLGASNAVIGYLSLLGVPIWFKPIWAPFVDAHGEKRIWLIASQSVLALSFAVLAAMLFIPGINLATVAAAFFVIVFIMTFSEIGSSYTLTVMNDKEIAFFSGIFPMFYRFGLLFGSSVLILIVGFIDQRYGSMRLGWGAVIAVCALLTAGFTLYMITILPRSPRDRPNPEGGSGINFTRALIGFARLPGAWAMIGYLFFYRLGEGLLNGMKIPFILDPIGEGGLGMDNAGMGLVTPATVIPMILGGVASAFLLRKYSLRQLILPLAFFMSLPNLLFVYLAIYPQYHYWTPDFGIIGLPSMTAQVNTWGVVVLALEALGYGLAFTPFQFAHFRYARMNIAWVASFNTIMFSIVMFGFMLPGIVSGVLEETFGYGTLFIFSTLLGLPAFVFIWFLPYEAMDRAAEAEDAAL